jgi:prophage regulatory protein
MHMQNVGKSTGANTAARSERFLRFREVASRTCLSKTEIYRRIAAGTFPTNVKIGARAVAWRETEVDAWIHALVQQQRPQGTRGSNG